MRQAINLGRMPVVLAGVENMKQIHSDVSRHALSSIDKKRVLLLSLWLMPFFLLSGCHDDDNDEVVLSETPMPQDGSDMGSDADDGSTTETPTAMSFEFSGIPMTAEQVVGSESDTSTGDASVDVSFDSPTSGLAIEAQFQGLEPDRVQLRSAFAGDVGDVIENLENQDSGIWLLPSDTVLDSELLTQLLEGGLYLLATTGDDEVGLLRAQIIPPNIRVMRLMLSGDQEVPPISDSDASAVAFVTLNSDSNQVTIHANTSDLSGPATMAHLHQGAVGENGGILADMQQDAVATERWSLESFELDSEQMTLFESSSTYINIHTEQNPGGEVRGQVLFEGLGSPNPNVQTSESDIQFSERMEPLVTAGSEASEAPTFNDIQNDILTMNCAVSGCHTGATPAAGLNLSEGLAFDNIVGSTSSFSDGILVLANDSANSLLFQKIGPNPPFGRRMPLGRSPLSDDDIQRIADWIDAGALDNE